MDRPKLCTECKHFRRAFLLPADLGKCVYDGKERPMSLVDGKFYTKHVGNVRRYECRGDWWNKEVDDHP